MFLRSNRLGNNLELCDGRTGIGRRNNCDVVIDRNRVSKQHLEVDISRSGARVRDRESHVNCRATHRKIRGLGWGGLTGKDFVDLCGYDFRLLEKLPPQGTSGDCMAHSGDEYSDLSGPGSYSISLAKVGNGDAEVYSQLKALLAITDTLRDVLETEGVLARAVKMMFQIIPAWTVQRSVLLMVNCRS